ncbi:hypothetical protein GCM10027063_16070 [Promicromonospora xylanilytica]
MTLETALLLAGAADVTRAGIDRELSRIGVSLGDLRRLRVIRESGGASRDVLAAALVESRSQAVRSTLPLEKLGWVERTDDGVFVLTASGRALLAVAEEIADAVASRRFAECGVDTADLSVRLGPLTR